MQSDNGTAPIGRNTPVSYEPPGTSRPGRVLFITRKWPPACGGMETYSRELTSALSQRADTHLDILALPGRPDGRPPRAISLLRFFAAAAWHLLTRGRRVDAVHLADMVLWPLAVWCRLVAPRTRTVITMHGLDLLFARRTSLAGRIYRAYIAGARMCARALDARLANSRATARVAMRAGIPATHVIPLGVRLPSITARPLPEHRRVILFVGRLCERKGAAWFAENVLPHLPADVEFHVAGPEGDPRERRRLLAAGPRVQLLGRLSDRDLADRRARARAVVMPNVPGSQPDIEGFGLTALEAPAQGAVLIAADFQGISDAVIHRQTGFLVPTLDIAGWTARVSEVLAWSYAERTAFVARAQEALRAHYAWSGVAAETRSAYSATPGLAPVDLADKQGAPHGA
mgnify:CR=1 FL=1